MDYTLKGFDNDIGAIRMGHRFYDPKSKRFLSPDIFILENPSQCEENAIACTGYVYASNNPLTRIDKDGNQDFGIEVNLPSANPYSQLPQVESVQNQAASELQMATQAVSTAADVAMVGAAVATITLAGIGASQVAIPLAATNPEAAITALGATVSFAQGLISGVTNTEAPAKDGGVMPGNEMVNLMSSKAGEAVGAVINEKLD